MAVANSGWSRADFKPLMELVLPEKPATGRRFPPATGDEGCGRRRRRETRRRAGAPASQVGDFALDQLKNFFQAQGGDAVEVFQIDGLKAAPSGGSSIVRP